MPLTGEFGKFAGWSSAVGRLATGTSQAEVSRQMADATAVLIREQFATSRDPFGNPWAPKKKPDGRPVGTGKTGQLKRYRVQSASAFGFSVYSPTAPYRKFFHGGTRKMKARPVSPGIRIPRRWNDTYERIWGAHCRTKLRLSR